MRSRRVSDILSSNWKFVWGMNIIIFKFLHWLGYFNTVLKGCLFPSPLLLFYSANFTLLLIFLAFVFDIVAKLCRRTSNSSNVIVHLKTCKGRGICWHAYPNCYVVYDHWNNVLNSILQNVFLISFFMHGLWMYYNIYHFDFFCLCYWLYSVSPFFALFF